MLKDVNALLGQFTQFDVDGMERFFQRFVCLNEFVRESCTFFYLLIHVRAL